MPRVISFIVLLAIISLVGAIFFRVMAQFIVPLFLTAVLVVVFQPLHNWMLRRLPDRPRLCALLTTILILLVVLLPTIWLGWGAYRELRDLARATVEVAEVVDLDALMGVEPADPPPADEAPAVELDEAAEPEEAELVARLRRFVDDVRMTILRTTGVEITDADLRQLADWLGGFLGAAVLTGVQAAFGVVIGLAIMVIALYYFLADGPALIRWLMYLSPLDDTYERELLARFGEVSRAVVVAVFLSAAAQGALAGVGFYFALSPTAPVFLLTALTILVAIIPFIGAAVVWVPVCIYIYFYGARLGPEGEIVYDGNWVVALMLALYSALVVSMIDNVIKPLVLHGQSGLHPLLALLSILGGVTALGPVGLIVGPMVVSFLQALLIMLRKELDIFGGEEGRAEELAKRDYNVPQNVVAHRAQGEGAAARGEPAPPAAREDAPAAAREAAPAPTGDGAESVSGAAAAATPEQGEARGRG